MPVHVMTAGRCCKRHCLLINDDFRGPELGSHWTPGDPPPRIIDSRLGPAENGGGSVRHSFSIPGQYDGYEISCLLSADYDESATGSTALFIDAPGDASTYRLLIRKTRPLGLALQVEHVTNGNVTGTFGDQYNLPLPKKTPFHTMKRWGIHVRMLVRRPAVESGDWQVTIRADAGAAYWAEAGEAYWHWQVLLPLGDADKTAGIEFGGDKPFQVDSYVLMLYEEADEHAEYGIRPECYAELKERCNRYVFRPWLQDSGPHSDSAARYWLRHPGSRKIAFDELRLPLSGQTVILGKQFLIDPERELPTNVQVIFDVIVNAGFSAEIVYGYGGANSLTLSMLREGLDRGMLFVLRQNGTELYRERFGFVPFIPGFGPYSAALKIWIAFHGDEMRGLFTVYPRLDFEDIHIGSLKLSLAALPENGIVAVSAPASVRTWLTYAGIEECSRIIEPCREYKLSRELLVELEMNPAGCGEHEEECRQLAGTYRPLLLSGNMTPIRNLLSSKCSWIQNFEPVTVCGRNVNQLAVILLIPGGTLTGAPSGMAVYLRENENVVFSSNLFNHGNPVIGPPLQGRVELFPAFFCATCPGGISRWPCTLTADVRPAD